MMIKLAIVLVGALLAVSYADASLNRIEDLKAKLKHRYPGSKKAGNYANAAGTASAHGGSGTASASAAASASASGYGARPLRPVAPQGYGANVRHNYGDYEDRYNYGHHEEPSRARYGGYGDEYGSNAGASAAASSSAGVYAAPPVPEAPAAPSIHLDTFRRHNNALNYRPAVRFGGRPAVYGSGATASSAAAVGGSRGGFGGSAASAAASAGTGLGVQSVRGPAVPVAHAMPVLPAVRRSAGAGAAASASAVAGAGISRVRGPTFAGHGYEGDEMSASSVAAGAGTYANDDGARESSSYKRSTENVENHEDGRADDDHYYNAQSYGKADDENLHEAFNKNNEDVEQSAHVYRSKKNAENYVLDYNKARRESGSGVLASDKHSSAYNKNSKRFVENVKQKQKKEGSGILENVNQVSSHNFDDEDEEIYDSDGFGHPQRGFGGAAASSAAAAAGSVATSAAAAGAH